MKARIIRERAWTELEGNWGKAVLAYLLFLLAGATVSQLLTRIGIAMGGIEVKTLGSVIAQMGIDLPQDLPLRLMDAEIHDPKLSYRILQGLVQTLLGGVLQAGWALFAVALMRKGASVMQVFSGFSRFFSTGWLNIAITIRILLWSLLLVVPGIVAAYSYRQAFFLKADHPKWSAGRVIAESKHMMKGHKWRLACLDASFIGWILVGCFTFGLGFLFVVPYMNVANAAFYENLLDNQ